MSPISGTTRVFPVIGWPVEQVKAPLLFNAYFEHHGIDAVVVPLKVEPAVFAQTVRTLMAAANVGGILVSIPHKPGTLEAVDEVTARAQMAGACNAVLRKPDGQLLGDLIDGEGFVRALDRQCRPTGFDYAGSKALIVGCGGVGSAIAAALAERGIRALRLHDVHPEQAALLKQKLALSTPRLHIELGGADPRSCALVVNASPVGMDPADPSPVDGSLLEPGCVVADCVMKVEMTALLRAAQARGCRIQKGREMLIEQAPLYLELFGWPGATAEDFRALGVL